MPRTLLQGPTQYQTTSLPERWPLVQTFNGRCAFSSNGPVAFNRNLDHKLINGYIEMDPETKEIHVIKRPGYSAKYADLSGTGVGKGIARFESGTLGTTMFLAVNGTTMSRVSNNGVVTPITAGLTGSQGNGWWQKVPSAPTLMLYNDGTNAGYTESLTYTTLVGVANFPANFVRGWAYVDGWTFVMDRNARIVGTTNPNDPTAWSATNVIVAQEQPDFGVALAKHKEYVVALKQTSVEFFQNVGNPTGSVLQRLAGSRLDYGCRDAFSVVEIDGMLFWVSTNLHGRNQVMKLENMQSEIISDPFIERLLDQIFINFPTVSATVLKVAGHRFYVLSLFVGSVFNMTFVYDLDYKFWSIWGADLSEYWPINSFSGADVNGNYLVQNIFDGDLYQVGDCFFYPTDNGVAPAVDIYTPNFDAGTIRTKTLVELFFTGDMIPGGILQARFSDDDYQTWSQFRDVNLANRLPRLNDNGSFIRRAYHLRHKQATSFRIRAMNMQLDIGTL